MKTVATFGDVTAVAYVKPATEVTDTQIPTIDDDQSGETASDSKTDVVVQPAADDKSSETDTSGTDQSTADTSNPDDSIPDAQPQPTQ